MESIPAVAPPVNAPPSALEQRLLAEGFAPGSPPHINVYTEELDAVLCSRSRCAVCRRRGLKCKPVHRGRQYRVIAACPTCGHGEER